MKIRTWKVGIAALALGASPALAAANEWSYDDNVSAVAFASDCCETSCSDPCDVACGDGCRGGYLGALEDLSLASLVG
ncbi:MAG: hypothetical protein IT424_03915, partial [Pirellulales bacterium]|nr:hypothetical protein [Pirellulales bacterium]